MLIARAAAHRRHGLAAPIQPVPVAEPPTLIESDYGDRLASLVARWRWVINGAVNEVWDLWVHGIEPAASVRHDAAPPEARIRRAFDKARETLDGAFDPQAFERMAAGIGARVAEYHRVQLNGQVKSALGVDVVLRDQKVPQLIDGFAHRNVALIKTLQRGTVDKLESMVMHTWSTGQRAASIEQEISDRFGVSERHARLIARDQIGKLNGQVTGARHQELGIASFIWKSVQDARVRPLHRILNGQRFRYDNLPSEGLPGTPIACRCGQQPVFDDLVAELDAQEAPAEIAQAAETAEAKIARPRTSRAPKTPEIEPVAAPTLLEAAGQAAAPEAEPIIWEGKKNPKRVEAAKKAAEASVERRREIYSAVASNLSHDLQSTWAKEGYRFMQNEAPRIRGVKDRINAASKISEAFTEQYGAGAETTTGYEGDRYHRRAEIEAQHAETWANEQERKYYAAAERAEQESLLSSAVHDDDIPF